MMLEGSMSFSFYAQNIGRGNPTFRVTDYEDKYVSYILPWSPMVHQVFGSHMAIILQIYLLRGGAMIPHENSLIACIPPVSLYYDAPEQKYLRIIGTP